MGYTLGMNGKFYYDPTPLTGDQDADYDGATWTLIDNTADLTQNLETGESDITTRGNNGWRATAPTLKDGTIEFEMVWDTADAAFQAIKNAWENSAEIALAAMDGLVTVDGSEGLVGNFTITNFSRTEPLEEAMRVQVTAKPSSYNNWWVTTIP